MPFSYASAASQPGKGTTRAIDLVLDMRAAGIVPGGNITNATFYRRSGLAGPGLTVSPSPVYCVYNGRAGYRVLSGLGAAAGWDLGLGVCTLQPTFGGQLATQQQVTIYRTSLAAGSFVSPNNDVGMVIKICSGTSTGDLIGAPTGSASGQSGFGVMMLGNAWCYVMKLLGQAQNTVTEQVTLVWPTNDPTIPVDCEFRIYDATLALPGSVELWIAGVKQLTRYWVNPAGVVTPVLPPFASGVGGMQLRMAHRNTSTGPAYVEFYDVAVIQGPADAGTI